MPGVSDFLTRLPGALEEWTLEFVEPGRLASALLVEVDGYMYAVLQSEWRSRRT